LLEKIYKLQKINNQGDNQMKNDKLKNNKIALVVRYFLGIALVFFALNGFFQFMTPPAMGDAANAFMAALGATGYMFVLINLVQLAVGISLLSNKFVPLALIVLAPLTVNIILFHLFLHVQSILFGAIVAVLHIYLASVNMNSYKNLLKP
jgi:putative oxidoreductase